MALNIKQLVWRVLSICLSERHYLQLKYCRIMGKHLNLNSPQTYTEKLQWLKLYDRKPFYTTLVDKYLVKQWVSDKIGPEHVTPLLGVWENALEIDFESLPSKFVLKCNHNSGNGVVICKDKSSLDIQRVREYFDAVINEDYYSYNLEWPYKNIKRKIIAEQLLEDDTRIEDTGLTDYKFFCFNGVPKVLYISNDKSLDPRTDFFDMDFVHLPIRMRDKNSDVLPEKPERFEEMKKYAAILSEGIPHVRVDFYVVNGIVFFGEMTFFHCGGYAAVEPKEWNHILGSWIDVC